MATSPQQDLNLAANVFLSKEALTTVSKVKALLKIPSDNIENDELIADAINQVTDAVIKYCDRSFGKKLYSEPYAGSGRPNLVLKQMPILSVESVIVNNMPYSTDQYIILHEEGMLTCRGIWPRAAHHGGMLTPEPMEPAHNIFVTYYAGYVLPKDSTPDNPRTLPYDLEGVVQKMAVQQYLHMVSWASGEEDLTEIVKSESLGDWSISFDYFRKDGSKLGSDPKMDESAKMMMSVLDRWRRKI